MWEQVSRVMAQAMTQTVSQVAHFLPGVVVSLALLAVAAILAVLVRGLVGRALDGLDLDRRAEQLGLSMLADWSHSRSPSHVIARAVVGANHGDPGKLALRAGHGSEAHGLHAGDFPQHLLQLVHAGQESLGFGSERVAPKKFGQHGEAVARLGVVFHGA